MELKAIRAGDCHMQMAPAELNPDCRYWAKWKARWDSISRSLGDV